MSSLMSNFFQILSLKRDVFFCCRACCDLLRVRRVEKGPRYQEICSPSRQISSEFSPLLYYYPWVSATSLTSLLTVSVHRALCSKTNVVQLTDMTTQFAYDDHFLRYKFPRLLKLGLHRLLLLLRNLGWQLKSIGVLDEWWCLKLGFPKCTTNLFSKFYFLKSSKFQAKIVIQSFYQNQCSRKLRITKVHGFSLNYNNLTVISNALSCRVLIHMLKST
jgi:hypothetical protein